MNALIYLRVSTKERAEKGEATEGYSIPAQREACVRLCAERGLNVLDEFVDAGESARSSDRPSLKVMLSRVGEGDIGAIVVHKIDRQARNTEDHVAIRAALRRHGCQLVSVTENIEETASGKLVEGIHALMAEFYSAKTSRRKSRRAWPRRPSRAGGREGHRSVTSAYARRSGRTRCPRSCSTLSAPCSCARRFACTQPATTRSRSCSRGSRPKA